MARLLIAIAVIAVVFEIWAAVDCALTERRRVRGLPKPLWLLIVLLLPPVGGLLWVFIGRGPERRRRRRPAPDDDPAFLGPRRRPASPPSPSPVSDDEVLSRLERELAKPDPDADDDQDPRSR